MQYQERESAKSAEQILNDFTVPSEVKLIRKTLKRLFHEWIASENQYDQEQRCEVLADYLTVMEFLKQVQAYQKERRSHERVN